MQIPWTMRGSSARVRLLHHLRALAALMLLPAAGCDPCAGTAKCSVADDVVVMGAIVHHASGAPVGGALVIGRFTGPDATLIVDTAVTDAEGQWTLRREIPGEEAVSASFRVEAPGATGYRVPTIPLRRPATAGDAVHVGTWMDMAFAHFIANATWGGNPLRDAEVSFERLAGIDVTVEETSGVTGRSGEFFLRLAGDSAGAVVGTIILDHPDRGLLKKTGVPIALDYRWKTPTHQATFDMKPRIFYGGSTLFLGTLETVGGVTWSFRRTSGIGITPSEVTVVSNAQGYFNWEVTPLAAGNVYGTVTVTGPNGQANVYTGVRFATFDSLYGRDSGPWGYGEAWKWSVEIRRAGTESPVAGATATFRQKSGPTLSPATISGWTDADGRFLMTSRIRDTGVVVGDLTLTPAGEPSSVIRDLRLRTNPDNAYHPAGVYHIP